MDLYGYTHLHIYTGALCSAGSWCNGASGTCTSTPPCTNTCSPGATQCQTTTTRQTCVGGCPGTRCSVVHHVSSFWSLLYDNSCSPPRSLSLTSHYTTHSIQALRLLGEALTTALQPHPCAIMAHASPIIVLTPGILILVAHTRLVGVSAANRVYRKRLHAATGATRARLANATNGNVFVCMSVFQASVSMCVEWSCY
jgi:hypothetical protein